MGYPMVCTCQKYAGTQMIQENNRVVFKGQKKTMQSIFKLEKIYTNYNEKRKLSERRKLENREIWTHKTTNPEGFGITK